MVRIEIDLDEETGLMTWLHDWYAEAQLEGDARVAWLSLHNRYKAVNADLFSRHHERAARRTEKLLEDEPKIRVFTKKVV